jgi:hypothetical protein
MRLFHLGTDLLDQRENYQRRDSMTNERSDYQDQTTEGLGVRGQNFLAKNSKSQR